MIRLDHLLSSESIRRSRKTCCLCIVPCFIPQIHCGNPLGAIRFKVRDSLQVKILKGFLHSQVRVTKVASRASPLYSAVSFRATACFSKAGMNHSWRMRENSCANKGIVISDRPLVSGRRKRQKELASIISEKNRPRNKGCQNRRVRNCNAARTAYAVTWLELWCSCRRYRLSGYPSQH